MPLMDLGVTSDEIAAMQKAMSDDMAELARTPATKANTQVRSRLQNSIDYYKATLPGMIAQFEREHAVGQQVLQPSQPLTPPAIDYGKEDSPYGKYMIYGLGAVGLLIVYKMFFMKKSA